MWFRDWRIRRILSAIKYQDYLFTLACADQKAAEAAHADYAANRCFERAVAARKRQDALREELKRIGGRL